MQDMQDAIDRIPPEAWPFIDLLFRITIALVVVWLVLAIFAWWRRRAYNLTIAATARKTRKGQPDFLKVDRKAREAAIARGAAHEDVLEAREREEALAALRAAKDPIGWTQRIVGIGAFIMSIITLGSTILGAFINVSKMGEGLQQMPSGERIVTILTRHWFISLVMLVVVAWHIYQYFIQHKWKEA